ncbi:MAG: hypothetical protein ABUT20_60280 [Bacteroidota bacterium]
MEDFLIPGVHYTLENNVLIKWRDLRGDSTLIPVQLSNYVLRTKFIRPFQVYLYLKSICSGKIKKEKIDFNQLAKKLNLKSEKRIQNSINLLLKVNWIGYNVKNNCYYIRSFEKVIFLESLTQSRTASEFFYSDIKKIKSFCIASVIGSLINRMKRRAWFLGREKGRPFHATHALSFYPVANDFLAKVLGISKTTAYRYKLACEKAKYIKIKKTFQTTKFTLANANFFRRVNPEYANRIRIRNKVIVIQQPDTINHCIRFKRRKKMKPFIKG